MRLVLAVFEDAIRAAARQPTGRSRRARLDYLEARAWVEDTDRSWPFAFPNVCDLLGLDADAVRRRVLLGHVPADTDGRRQRRGRLPCAVAHEPAAGAPRHDGREAGTPSAAARQAPW
jgi:hypothetical protein